MCPVAGFGNHKGINAECMKWWYHTFFVPGLKKKLGFSEDCKQTKRWTLQRVQVPERGGIVVEWMQVRPPTCSGFQAQGGGELVVNSGSGRW